MCCCCDTYHHINGYLASIKRHLICSIFDESEGKHFAVLNKKSHSQNEKTNATQKSA